MPSLVVWPAWAWGKGWIGGGTGRDVAMVAGAVGGALAGNAIQKNYDKPIPAQQNCIPMPHSGVLVQRSPNRPAQRCLSASKCTSRVMAKGRVSCRSNGRILAIHVRLPGALLTASFSPPINSLRASATRTIAVGVPELKYP